MVNFISLNTCTENDYSSYLRNTNKNAKNKTLTSKLFEKGHPPVKVTKTSLSSLRKPLKKND